MTEPDPAPPPLNPYWVLAAAIGLPGSGHVLLRMPTRGLQFIFFTVILAWVTMKLAPPDASFIGRHAGGLLIYALSVLDAYKIARIRYATWTYGARESDVPPLAPHGDQV